AGQGEPEFAYPTWFAMLFSGGMAAAVTENVPTALFVTFDRLPLAAVTSAIATLMVATFFVTPTDWGALVLSIIGSGGDSEPAIATRIFWAALAGAVAAAQLVS